MRFSKEMLKGSAEIIVLKILADENENYGYELIKAIRAQSNDIFHLQEGTLYPLLYRLEKKKYITSTVKKAASGKDRRYYSLTSVGKKILAQGEKEIQAFARGLKNVFHFSL
ncbi:MAG: hypothetical protein A3F54_04110 [Candidatus Kerfeldbacteria bacterium RIFCSPHIGHO2_12_FULL_48_17]|uniref:Transcription regulator PadR N-terminal domain-containing protein n=1 Tax=Candidatus Kerfeldbacteria bacterium RIFCSPHIGHO2_12_FULL_48_17 TaxID=1798542 RepID=A0A1G2B7V3_9BACT|nr:MAG: hypothetical protein A3F54_04110 [Candidatus Kerfeldbacteria bacterium RIFCSPHIGHO2_12_FULL_48_17]